MATVQSRRHIAPPQHDVEEEDDAIYDTRPPTSTRRYTTMIPSVSQENTLEPVTRHGKIIPKRSSLATGPQTTGSISQAAITQPPVTDRLQGEHNYVRRFPLISILVGMVTTMVLLMSISAVASWWQGYQDDIHYGRPRTYQFDAVVGHNDSINNKTHFICINLHRHVEIIEIPGGDSAHMRLYIGPTLFGDRQDLTPVTAEIRDVNHDGKPDLVVHIQNQQIYYINDGATFHAQ